MLIIAVKSTQTTNKSGTSGKGKPYSITEQEGWIDLANGERRKVRLTLQDGKPPFAIGEYTLGADSYFVGDYGALQLGRLDLVPLKAALAKVS
jgi:hypothetical protein